MRPLDLEIDTSLRGDLFSYCELTGLQILRHAIVVKDFSDRRIEAFKAYALVLRVILYVGQLRWLVERHIDSEAVTLCGRCVEHKDFRLHTVFSVYILDETEKAA